MADLAPPPILVAVAVRPWYKSATVWLNIGSIAAAVVTGLLELDWVRASLGVGTLGVLNVLLRVFKTNAPVTVAGKIIAPIPTSVG